MKRDPLSDSKFGLRPVVTDSPKQRRRRMVLWILVFVAAAMTPASFLGWVGFYRWLVEREPPVISVPVNFVGFGGNAQLFTFRIQDRLSGLRSIEVSLEQNGRVVQLFERDYPSGMLIDDPSFFIDAKALDLEPGSATIRLSGNDRSLWRNRATVNQQIILDYDAPKLEIVHMPTAINSNTLSYGAVKVSDGNPVRVEINIDGREFPADRIQATDIYLSLLTGFTEGTRSVPIALTAIDAVGNKTALTATTDLRPGSSGKHLSFDLQFEVLKEALVRLFERYRSQRRALNPEDNINPPKGSDPQVMAKFVQSIETDFGSLTEKLTVPLFRSTTTSIFWSRHFAKIPGQTKYAIGDLLNMTLDGIPALVRKSRGYFVEAKYASPVFSLNAGRVVFTDLFGPYGETVVVDHGFGLFSIYSNLESISVREGDEVERGEPIARVGRTGIFPRDGYQIEFRVRNYPVRAEELIDPNGVMVELLGAIKKFSQQ